MPLVYAGSSVWPAELPRSAVAIGNFDGVHAGHREVLARLAEAARRHDARSVAYTFDPAPTAVVAPQRHQPRILDLPDRVRLLGEAGVEAVIVEPFTAEFAAQPAEWFVHEVLERRLRAAAIVVGYDFRFGMSRGGDATALRARLPHVEVIEVGAHVADGAPVSSSRIRKLIAAGEVEAGAALLGRPHALHGVVVHGDARGRTIGFPTANLQNVVELLPADGVYATRASVDGGPPRASVTNIGVRPTFAGREHRIEVHLLDVSEDLYGRPLRIELVARIRGEQRFAGLEELQVQISRDVAAARARLG